MIVSHPHVKQYINLGCLVGGWLVAGADLLSEKNTVRGCLFKLQANFRCIAFHISESRKALKVESQKQLFMSFPAFHFPEAFSL
jgi:hypothetical protein